MFLRQALLASLLVSGTTAVAAAQTGEYPFRRFGSRDRIMLHPDVRTFRFSTRDRDRMRTAAERVRVRVQERSHDMANRMRLREFSTRDFAMQMRNRGFALHDFARRHQFELRARDQELMRDRLKDRMNHFRFERPMIIRRHSRTI
jgi:hypothetical protein